MSQKLLSICIPTYNREDSLKRLLDDLVLQALEFRQEIEICISNNHSVDNTREVVMIFKKQFPDLIKYNENEENLGFDKNLLEVIIMAEGEFVWTLSDDDLIIKNGLREIIKFIKENKDKNVGGMALKDDSYLVNVKTGERIKYHSSVDKNKLEIYEGVGLTGILQEDVPYKFLSVLIFNNKLLKKILKENWDLAEKGIGSYYLHSWLYLLLFILNKEAKYCVLNKAIVISLDTKTKYKFLMEDYFKLIYKGKIELFDKLLSVIDKKDREIIKVIKKSRGHSTLSIMYAMALFKAFKVANYKSCVKCAKLSFEYLSFVNALFVSIFLIIILIIPSVVVKKVCKLSLKLRFKSKEERESNWLETCVAFNYWNRGNRSIVG